MRVIGSSVQEAWPRLLHHLLQYPEQTISPRGLMTREITGVSLLVTDLRQNLLRHPLRNLNVRFAVAEWLWIAFGRGDLATLARYNKQMSRFSDDGLNLAGAYGPRLVGQWDYVIDTLRGDPASRQAVATIWTPCPSPSRDISCTLSFQFLARKGKLNLIVTMRSSDIWLGLPYDCFTFGQLASSLAGILGLDTGYLLMQLGSSHLYEEHVEKAKELLQDSSPQAGIISPRLPAWPPPDLEDILVSPRDHSVLSLNEPWLIYAKVLKADTWQKGYEHLAATAV